MSYFLLLQPVSQRCTKAQSSVLWSGLNDGWSGGPLGCRRVGSSPVTVPVLVSVSGEEQNKEALQDAEDEAQ